MRRSSCLITEYDRELGLHQGSSSSEPDKPFLSLSYFHLENPFNMNVNVSSKES